MKYGKVPVGIERVLVPVPLNGITTLYVGSISRGRWRLATTRC